MVTTEAVSIAMAVGTLVPLLVAMVNRPTWGKRTRTYMAIGVAAILGSSTYVIQNGLHFTSVSNIILDVVGVIMASNVAYNTLWKPTGLAEKLEIKTSPLPPETVAAPTHAYNEDGTPGL